MLYGKWACRLLHNVTKAQPVTVQDLPWCEGSTQYNAGEERKLAIPFVCPGHKLTYALWEWPSGRHNDKTINSNEPVFPKSSKAGYKGRPGVSMYGPQAVRKML